MPKRKLFIHCSFTAADLKKVPHEELAFLIACAHMCNEIISIAAYHLFENKTNQVVAQRFINARQLILIRHVLLRLYEFKSTYDSYIGILKNSKKLNEIEELKKIFGGHISSINDMKFTEFRNTIGNHYSLDKLVGILKTEISDDRSDLGMIVGENMGELYFEFVDEIIMGHFGKKTGKGDLQKGIEKIFEFSISTRFGIANSCYEYISLVFDRYGVNLRRQHQFVPSDMFVSPDAVAIPLFLQARDEGQI